MHKKLHHEIISEELAHKLALLGGADPAAAQALIASMPYDDRVELSVRGLIGPIVKRRGAVSPIHVTAFGWGVIRSCVEAYPVTESQELLWTVELEEARAKWREGN
jgi:hypothetical protein